MNRFQQYKYVVFDFDGTIAHLSVDWDALRQEVYRRFHGRYRFSAMSLWHMYETILKGESSDVAELCALIAEYEQPGGEVLLTEVPGAPTLLRQLPSFHVISNNLHSTVLQGVEKLALAGQCTTIIGLDDTLSMKPSVAPFKRLVSLTGDSEGARYLYIGDRGTDREFARNAGMAFAYITELT